MLIAGIAATQITHIAITHFHGDHCLGLGPSCSASRWIACRTRSRSCIRPAARCSSNACATRRSITSARRWLSAPSHRRGRPARSLVERGGAASCRPLDHRVDCFGYRLQSAMAGGCVLISCASAASSVRRCASLSTAARSRSPVRRCACKMSASPGAARCSRWSWIPPCPGAGRLAEAADLLVSEATFQSSEAQEAHDYQHMTAAQAATLARDAGAHTLVLTHFFAALHHAGRLCRRGHADFPEHHRRARLHPRAGFRRSPHDAAPHRPRRSPASES